MFDSADLVKLQTFDPRQKLVFVAHVYAGETVQIVAAHPKKGPALRQALKNFYNDAKGPYLRAVLRNHGLEVTNSLDGTGDFIVLGKAKAWSAVVANKGHIFHAPGVHFKLDSLSFFEAEDEANGRDALLRDPREVEAAPADAALNLDAFAPASDEGDDAFGPYCPDDFVPVHDGDPLLDRPEVQAFLARKAAERAGPSGQEQPGHDSPNA